MAKLVYGLQQSLDGYVDHRKMGPPPEDVYRHFLEHVRSVAGSLYGHTTYEIMRYWDEDQEDWGELEREFAAAWRAMPKWVMSRSQPEVGPNATLLPADWESAVRKLKAEKDGVIAVAGPKVAQSLTEAGLMDEYQLYFRPLVLGAGDPFFAGLRPPLRLTAMDRIGESVVRLTYVPA